jgi:PKD domain
MSAPPGAPISAPCSAHYPRLCVATMRTRLRFGAVFLYCGGMLALAACSHKSAPPAATPTASPAGSPTASKQAEAGPTDRGKHGILLVLIDANPDEGKAPLQVQFTVDHPPDSGQPPVTYHWTFGDGTESAEENPKHIYPKPGSYDVTVVAKDASGDEDDDETIITVHRAGEAE